MGWTLWVIIGMVIFAFVRAYRRNLRTAKDVKRNVGFVERGTVYPRGNAVPSMDYRYLRTHLEKIGTYRLDGEAQTYSVIEFESGLTPEDFDKLERQWDHRLGGMVT